MTSLWLARAGRAITDPYPAGEHVDTIVVGAGITGLTTALLLARTGMRVAVLEARQVGAAATGNTSAKLSLLQGDVLGSVRHHTNDRVLQAYVDGNLAGRRWLLDYLEARAVPVQHRDAWTFATTAEGVALLEAELAASRAAGLPVERDDQTELPFPIEGALRLRDQAQFDPMDVLLALAEDVRAAGGLVVEGERVVGVDAGKPATVSTASGPMTADAVVLATGAPILERGLYFAKTDVRRSYVVALRVPGGEDAIPRGMYLSIERPTHSLRTAPDPGGELLLVGGNGHPTGRVDSELSYVDELAQWGIENFPGAVETHRWSAQDYRSGNLIPFVGWLPRGRGRVYVATGYNKWGMTNGVAAALNLTADLTGNKLDWAEVLHHRRTHPGDLAAGIGMNAQVAATMTKVWVAAETKAPEIAEEMSPPADGTGHVGHAGRHPVAVSTIDGRTCALSAVCTHLGGIVHWNDAERSWDCPLHGSRFAPDGEVLEGPATESLRKA
jgi:glycine/D-amino acid oxidase-like deaminating enzyme/nitrite reductase/ring-hydroxylating ferredoxin subunit